MTDLKVIEGEGERNVLSITAGRSKRRDILSKCRYHRVLVDRSNRSVECSVCEASLDPIEELSTLARYVDEWRQMQKDRDCLSKEIQDLEKQIARLKGARQRARDAVMGHAGRVVDAARKHKDGHENYRGKPCTCEMCRALRSLGLAIDLAEDKVEKE